MGLGLGVGAQSGNYKSFGLVGLCIHLSASIDINLYIPMPIYFLSRYFQNLVSPACGSYDHGKLRQKQEETKQRHSKLPTYHLISFGS